jgi:hypothetical protein
MLPKGRRQHENPGEARPKRSKIGRSGKFPFRPQNQEQSAQPVDKGLDNFFTDWGKPRKLSNADFLSKNCPPAIHALPSAYTFPNCLIFFG